MKEIREYTKNDIPAMAELWAKAFNEEKEMPELLFEMLPNMGSAVVMTEDGELAAMATVIAGQEVQYASSGRTPEAGYIYGLAVDDKYRGRGYGREIARAAYDLAIKREAYIICTLPSDDGLCDFYSKILGFETALYRKRAETAARDEEMPMKMNATEYSMMRESLLKGSTYLRLSVFALDFERRLCELYGGGLFASMSGICTAQKDGDTCVIHEMISQNPEYTAASVAFSLGCKKAVWFTPCAEGEGEKYIMAEKGKIPPETVWNIAYD